MATIPVTEEQVIDVCYPKLDDFRADECSYGRGQDRIYSNVRRSLETARGAGVCQIDPD